MKPIAVGEATDPNVAPLLRELELLFAQEGIVRITPFAACVMSKAPLVDGPDPDDDATRPVAIPPRELWRGFVRAAKVVDAVAVDELGDLDLRFTGWRPEDYNKAVGGAKSSAHIRACAFDVWLGTKLLKSKDAKAIKVARERLKLAYARRYIRGGLVIGFGVYLNDIHFDVEDPTRTRSVTWEDAADWVKKARAK